MSIQIIGSSNYYESSKTDKTFFEKNSLLFRRKFLNGFDEKTRQIIVKLKTVKYINGIFLC